MFKKIIKGLKDVWCGSLEFDTTPKDGSYNPVTSGGVKKAISEAVADIPSIESAIPEGAGEEDQLVKSSELNAVDGRLENVESKIPSSASSTDKLVTKSELDNATASMESGYTPKGPASVSTLNAMLSHENGDQYIVTDSGTLTDGSLEVTAGESVAWDSTSETWYKVNQYALKSVQDNIVQSIATVFVPNVTNAVADKLYMYNGSVYKAKEDYTGAWDSSKFERTSISDLMDKICSIPIPYTTNVGYNCSTVGVAPTLVPELANDAFIKIDNAEDGDKFYIYGKMGVNRCWSKIKDGLVVEVIEANTTAETIVEKDSTWDELYLNFRDISTVSPLCGKVTNGLLDFSEIVDKRINAKSASDTAKTDKKLVRIMCHPAELQIGVGYTNDVVGYAPSAAIVDNTNAYVSIDGAVNGDKFYISGKMGVHRCWSKIKDGLVVEVIEANTDTDVLILKDSSWDSLSINFREIGSYPPICGKVLSGIDELEQIISSQTDEKIVDYVGHNPIINLTSQINADESWTTTVGQDIAPYTSGADVAAIVKKGLAVGTKVSVTGLSGVTRCWATLNGNKVVRIINSDSENPKTSNFVLESGEDGFVASFRNVSANTPSASIQFPDILHYVEYLIASSGTTKSDVKVLLVGSSFGVNTIVQFPKIAGACGEKIVCANMYRGSGTLADLKDSIANNTDYGTAAIWDYHDAVPHWKSVAFNKLSQALDYTEWDYIILQRAAPGKTGGSDTWTTQMADDFEYILNYIRSNTSNSPTILFNSVFGRPVDSSANAGSRAAQEAQALLIMSSAETMRSQFGVDIIPAAIAVQNARETSLSLVDTTNTNNYETPDLAGQGDHLDTGVGSYILGCLVYDFIFGKFGKSCLENAVIPTLDDVHGNPCFGDQYYTQITEPQAIIARYCAKCAIDNPSAINTAIAARFPQV